MRADESPLQDDFGPFTDSAALHGDTDDFGDFQTGANEAQLSSVTGTTWEEDPAWMAMATVRPDAGARSIP
jgi:hypothetical protein